MTGKKIMLARAKSKKVYSLIEAVIVGRTWTTKKLESQLVMVEIALASVRTAMELSSAGYNQGKGSQVAPKNEMKRKRPTAAPLAF